LVRLQERRPLAHDVVVAPLLLPKRLFYLLGVAPGFVEAAFDLLQARLRRLLLLNDLDGRFPVSAGDEFPRLAFFGGDELLLFGGVVREHLLVSYRPCRRHMKPLEVLELVLDGVFEQDLRVALLDTC
jgi:hypothetical protein